MEKLIAATEFTMDYGSIESKTVPSITDKTLGGIISVLLPYLLVGAGLILLIMLTMGGFTMLTGAVNTDTQAKGKKQVTTALIGFFIIFASYWIAQILQIIFQIEILG